MRLCRLAWSPYETEADRQAEREALGRRVQLVEPGTDAEILVAPSNVRVDAACLSAYPSARVVQTTTSGFDHVDLEAAGRAGLRVARLPMARRDAVVEVSLSLVLAGLHRLGALRVAAEQGRWARAELAGLGGLNLAGARVGVIGLGVIGRRFAELCRVLGAEVLGADPQGLPEGVHPATPEGMVRSCDALSIHASLSPGSRGLVNAELLGGARALVLVNTARGDILDLPAALAALDEGRLAFLGLDVFPQEPWPEMSTARDNPGLALFPHAAGYHRDLARLIRQGLAESVDALLRGEAMPWELTV